ncbi:Transcriptional regulator, TetR family [Rubellimicrobium mesophilum DSM 19309]|uniref:Transcriptional regulator, TetR family n=1 Tax=Rubellimicrobium mesophilum DSM 19309 TaxID=442562 RepID=A0A017HNB4_9RHOB|nr:TetR/AcrR family transcriptional regulator [Rubellimicrobium mesophilum]EYD75866.1 Transcriptional regulator, TetR family [Rubellimicrobium mesophilum DSM 19309]
MTRTYTLKKRAEKQAETRQRIVEAAMELHSTVGPASTSMSQIAERAGVQRHTLYAHFPDERSMALACSGLFAERQPLPDPEPWTAIVDPRDRLRTGLRALYAWYERNAGLLGCVIRDAEHHALTREMAEMRFIPALVRIREVLGDGVSPDRSALLGLALDFHTWRRLSQAEGLGSDTAAEAMIKAILEPTFQTVRPPESD